MSPFHCFVGARQSVRGVGNKLIRKGLRTLVLPRYGGPRRQPAE